MIPKTIEKIENRKIISDFLSFDRVWGSEAFLSLDDNFWRLATWYGYQDGANLGLIMMFKKISPTPVFLVGEPSCLSYIIRKEVKFDKIFVECPLSCVGVLKEKYNFDSASIMNKMKLEHFRPGSFNISPQVRRLTKEDFALARDLYLRNTEFGNFDPDQFEHGIYYGIQEGANIVSMVGTTVLCMDYRTATIGNVITDVEYRSKGYASSALILLCQALLELSYDCITIKVNRGNTHAVNMYRRLGFSKNNEYFEGFGTKK